MDDDFKLNYDDYKLKDLYFKHKYFSEESEHEICEENIKIIVEDIFRVLKAPNFLDKYPNLVYNKYILDELYVILWNYHTSYVLHQYLISKRISPFKRVNNSDNNRIKARILGSEGNYPNHEIIKNKNIYAFRYGIPILISTDIFHDDNSELRFINRNELKFASSIALTSDTFCNFYFDDYNGISVDERGLLGLSDQDIINFLFEMLIFTSKYSNEEATFIKIDVIYQKYKFSDYIKNLADFNEIYNSVNENDELLLRSLFYFIKGDMLWANRCFGEDALANILFSIEGALLLLQQKEGFSNSKINIEALEKIFTNNFKNGEDFFETIQDAYEQRIAIVHAHPRNGARWLPYLAADDFFQYYNITRFLFNFILRNKIIDKYW